MEVENTWMNNLLNTLETRIIDWEVFDKPHEISTEFFQELFLVMRKWNKTWIKPGIKFSKAKFYTVSKE